MQAKRHYSDESRKKRDPTAGCRPTVDADDHLVASGGNGVWGFRITGAYLKWEAEAAGVFGIGLFVRSATPPETPSHSIKSGQFESRMVTLYGAIT